MGFSYDVFSVRNKSHDEESGSINAFYVLVLQQVLAVGNLRSCLSVVLLKEAVSYLVSFLFT